jgi:hypothetical protein
VSAKALSVALLASRAFSGRQDEAWWAQGRGGSSLCERVSFRIVRMPSRSSATANATRIASERGARGVLSALECSRQRGSCACGSGEDTPMVDEGMHACMQNGFTGSSSQIGRSDSVYQLEQSAAGGRKKAIELGAVARSGSHDIIQLP